MKIVLIQARFFNIWEALGLGYIGALAKQHLSTQDRIEFYQGYFDSDETIVAACRDAGVVGFSCTSPTFAHAQALARQIKSINPKAYCVFGGWHPSAMPDISGQEGIDCVIIGEGDYAFSEVLQGRRESIICAAPVPDLNTLPFPDRELIKNHREIALAQKITGRRITSFQSIRGCPRNCAFCGEHAVSGKLTRHNPVRVRNPQHLMEEISRVTREYALDYFKFVDPTWNVSEEHVLSFCQEKLRVGNRLKWECNLHAATVTETMLSAMKQAGCCQINIGCESGSPRILRDMHKGITVDQVRQIFKWGRDIGLERRGYFLLGMPNETVEDIRLTEALIDDIQPDVVGITILCPYPGSSLYAKYMKDKTVDWSTTDEYTNDFWSTATLSNAELKHWQAYLVSKYKRKAAWHNKALLELP